MREAPHDEISAETGPGDEALAASAGAGRVQQLAVEISALDSADQVVLAKLLQRDVLASALGGEQPQPAVDEAVSAARISIPAERRSERRQRALKSAKMANESLYTVLDCVVRNLSSDGCKIELDSAAQAPSRFKLIFSSSGESKDVEVVWRSANELGVKFVNRG